MPPIGWLTSGIQFNELSAKLPVAPRPVEIFYGKFINNMITFVIVAFCVFLVVKAMNRVLRKEEAAPAKPTRSEELLAEIRDELKRR
jgi:large conductance mechanosensitive channel